MIDVAMNTAKLELKDLVKTLIDNSCKNTL